LDAEIYKYFLTQGPFALLFVWLLFSSRKDSKEREQKLYATIDEQNKILNKFSDKYDLVIGKLEDIKNRLPK
jgi:hypothetical protein